MKKTKSAKGGIQNKKVGSDSGIQESGVKKKRKTTSSVKKAMK